MEKRRPTSHWKKDGGRDHWYLHNHDVSAWSVLLGILCQLGRNVLLLLSCHQVF